MSPEAIAAVFGGLVSLLGAWNGWQGKRIKALERQLGIERDWRLTAIPYIGTLWFALRSNGLTPPEPPAALGLDGPGLPTGTDAARGDDAPGRPSPATG